jgi:hypothetical protein
MQSNSLNFTGHQRSASNQDNYPQSGYTPDLVKNSQSTQNAANNRRSLDNYT